MGTSESLQVWGRNQVDVIILILIIDDIITGQRHAPVVS